jgi:hypothetical protein
MAGEWMDKGENKELSARTIPQDCNLIGSCLIAATTLSKEARVMSL